MSPLSGGVLTGATVVASPALWASLVDGTLPLDVAITRFLIALAVCWAALSLVATWAFPDPGSIKLEPIRNEVTPDPAREQDERQ